MRTNSAAVSRWLSSLRYRFLRVWIRLLTAFIRVFKMKSFTTPSKLVEHFCILTLGSINSVSFETNFGDVLKNWIFWTHFDHFWTIWIKIGWNFLHSDTAQSIRFHSNRILVICWKIGFFGPISDHFWTIRIKNPFPSPQHLCSQDSSRQVTSSVTCSVASRLALFRFQVGWFFVSCLISAALLCR